MTKPTVDSLACWLHLPSGSARVSVGRKVQAIKSLFIAMPLLVCVGLTDARATSKEFTNGSSLTSDSNYTPAGVPGPTDNIVIDSGSPTGGSYTVGATLNVEDLSFRLTTATSVAGTSSTANTLELNGGRGSAIPLIDENSSKTLTIKSGSSSALNLLLGASGTFEIDSSGGLTVSSNIGQVNAGTTLTIGGTGSGMVTLAGTDSFSGGLIVIGAEVDVTSDTSLGAAGGSVTINGGRLGISGTFTLDPTRSIFLGANPTGGNNTGTLSITSSSSVITINNVLQNLAGSTGDFVKQGSGTLQLGGASSYSGSTFINNGVAQLVGGNNRLPTGTTLSLGQAASENVGTFDLNGFNQQVAGLNSTNATTKTPTSKNIVTTSTGTATLTLGGSGTYAYGDGTPTSSGVITGALSLVKSGAGRQTFGDNNTYTGSTTVSGGTLVAGTSTSGSSVQALASTSSVAINNSGTLTFGANNQINSGAPVTLGSSSITGTPTLNTGGYSQDTGHTLGALTLSSSSVINFTTLANGNANSILAFADSHLQTWTGTLSIDDYAGTSAGGGTDQLYVGTTSAGLTKAQLADVDFYNASGTFLGSGNILSDGEVVPGMISSVPEPATVLGGVLLVAVFGYSQRRRAGE